VQLYSQDSGFAAHAENSLNIRQLHGQDPKELADRLVAHSDRDRLEELAQQIVWLAQIVWTKNVWLQRHCLRLLLRSSFWSCVPRLIHDPRVLGQAGPCSTWPCPALT
jgi:hypothetical protein